MSTLKVDTWQNSSGLENFPCTAWVNFDGNLITIRDSGNVSSVVENATGDFTINFTNAMSNINYAIVATRATNTTSKTTTGPKYDGATTTSCRIYSLHDGVLNGANVVSVVIHGGR